MLRWKKRDSYRAVNKTKTVQEGLFCFDKMCQLNSIATARWVFLDMFIYPGQFIFNVILHLDSTRCQYCIILWWLDQTSGLRYRCMVFFLSFIKFKFSFYFIFQNLNLTCSVIKLGFVCLHQIRLLISCVYSVTV